MLLFIFITIVSLGFIPLSLLTKKKKIPEGIGAFSSLILGMAFVFNLTSVAYHAFGNQKAYEISLQNREDLMERYLEAKNDENKGSELQKVTKEIAWYNEELRQNKEMADSIWVNWYSYSYASEHFDELIITL